MMALMLMVDGLPSFPRSRTQLDHSISEIIASFDDNLQTVQIRSAQVSSGPEKDGFSFHSDSTLFAQRPSAVLKEVHSFLRRNHP